MVLSARKCEGILPSTTSTIFELKQIVAIGENCVVGYCRNCIFHSIYCRTGLVILYVMLSSFVVKI